MYRRCRRCILAATTLGLVAASWPGSARATETSEASGSPFAVVLSASSTRPFERLIVAAIVRGEGAGSLDLMREGGVFYLPVADLAKITGAEIAVEGEAVRFQTSLGDVLIPNEELRDFDGDLYLSEQVLEERLVTRFRFDLEEFAVRLDVPWEPLAEEEELVPDIQPDVAAPQASLSRLRLDLQHAMIGSDGVTTGTTSAAGRVGGGRWSLRTRTIDGDAPVVEDYIWARDSRHTLFQVGHQRMSLSGLTPGLNLTGAQIAWTNQDIRSFQRYASPGLLLADSQSAGVTLRGGGPPAGFAQLRVDGTVVDVQVIGLDGRYEFPDVILPSGRLTRVEVYLYDRSNGSVPVRIVDASQSTWDRLLPDGAVVHQGAVGVGGNPLDDASTADDDLAGFYQARFGVSDRLTLETTIQQSEGDTVATGGIVARLGRSLLTSVAVGTVRDAMGYEAVIENVRLPWRFLGQSRWNEAGYRSPDAAEFADHWVEIGYQPTPTFDLALYGRVRDQDGESTEYLLPGVNWYPLPQLNLRARPDADGDYRFDAFVYLGDSVRGALSRTGNDTGASLQVLLRDRLHQIRVTADFIGDGGERYTALLERTRTSRWSPTWEAGVTRRDDEIGFVARAAVPLMPGILLGAEYQDGTAFGVGGDSTVLVRITSDLSYSQGRFIAADSLPSRQDIGSLTGRIRVEAPESFERPSLADVLIEIDQRPSVRTERDGSFFVGNLIPGLYRVRMDPGELPIELTPVRTAYVVEVAEGAATRVDFVVRPLFGIAGRVTTSDGDRLAGIRVEVIDATGEVAADGITDRFGLYRVDGLPIGRFTVRVAGSPQASRAVEVVDDFLFGQDLTVEGWTPDSTQSE
jgi:hypothetical protein